MKNILLISCLCLLFSCSDDEKSNPAPSVAPLPSLSRIVFSGIGVSGIFDPSLTYDPIEAKLWMSYSDVNRSSLYPTDNPDAIQTRLAYSTDGGETWSDASVNVNSFVDVSLGAPFPSAEGTWMNETSSIVYDKSANPAQRWKLISHVYLMYKNSRLFEHGWIEYKEASTPASLATSPRIKLFSALSYNSINDTLNNTATVSQVGGVPKVALNTLHTDLNSCAVFAEGSLYSTSTALYVSMICFTGTDNRTFLLKCTGPCDVTNSGSWSYLGTIVTNSDAAGLGYAKFSASELFESNGSVYLGLSPVSAAPVTKAYNGCVFFKITDIDTASIDLTPVKTISGAANSFNGACAYDQSAIKSGFMYSEVNDILGANKEFRIYQGGDFL